MLPFFIALAVLLAGMGVGAHWARSRCVARWATAVQCARFLHCSCDVAELSVCSDKCVQQFAHRAPLYTALQGRGGDCI